MRIRGLLVVLAASASCQKPAVILRDPVVYRNEIAFFQLALEQDTELLEHHLADGSCTCDESGAWNNETCETTALNILVIRHRLTFHLDMMRYNAKLLDTRPAIEPEIPEPSTLCPAK